ncbi:NAD(P)H-dependent oxidoreductase, partial [Vibrio parahaemolyticus]|nr:NAD(P)H-dependent oxidoreductase [Vibrio parahaemolyticus]
MTNKKVLILFAHPSQHRSEVNTPLFKEAQKIEGVTCVDLYGEYPRFNINIDREQ